MFLNIYSIANSKIMYNFATVTFANAKNANAS